jgi:hypothetical protein
MRPTLDRTNRIVLGILGALLLAGAIYGIIRSYGGLGDRQADKPFLLEDVRTWVHRNDDWFWPLVAVLCICVAFAAIVWAWKQLPRPLPDDDLVYENLAGPTRVRASALSDAVQDDLERQPLVESARVALRHHDHESTITARLSVPDDTSIDAVVDDIINPALERLRHATQRTNTHADVTINYSDSQPPLR